jgi:iron complex outermembrane receptor protein
MSSFWIHVRRVAAATAVVALGLIGARADAQTTMATLNGTVLDPHGSAVVNATVVIRNDAAKFSRTTNTDGQGRFSVADIPAGVYEVETTMPGFNTVRRTGVNLTSGQVASITVNLTVAALSEQVDVSAAVPEAAKTAVSQGSLAARSAESTVSDVFVRDYTSPVADYSQVIQMTPGITSFSQNGPGLSDTKTSLRGFADAQITMAFDGIPFNDTNDASHHSWVFFPSQSIGGATVDRSPGSAASIGPADFGGSINLQSRNLEADQHVSGTVSTGSWNTHLFDGEYQSGAFGPNDSQRLTLDAQRMTSDGYETYNDQERNAFSGKYQWTMSPTSTLTAFTSIVDVNSNTPNTKGPTRAQVAQYGNNYLMSSDPTQPNYYGYNLYHVPTDFEYVGFKSDLGGGWTIDDKVYSYRYNNHQHYNGTTTISATSGTDKLNAYRKYGNLLPLTQTSSLGVLRVGLWSEYAMTNRYQTPTDPRTWVDAALPNFHEQFNTTSLQPYAEYEFNVGDDLKVTPGIKLSRYVQDFTQYADNGKTIGNLGGQPFVQHTAVYQNWLPSFDAHYRLQQDWSLYAQYSKGNLIPPTNVFDVKNALVSILPNATLTTTYEVGSVWKSNRATLDVDAYHVLFDSAYSSAVDSVGDTYYYAAGTQLTEGVEAEASVILVRGLSVYGNATAGSAKYTSTNLWVAGAPKDTEALGLMYRQDAWDAGLFVKRAGQLYNDNGATHQAVTIAPVTIVNLFINYQLKGTSALSRSKIAFAVNNLFNNQNIIGVNPASSSTSVPAPGDILTIVAARSVSLTMTIDFSKR